MNYTTCPKCQRRMITGRIPGHQKNGDCERWAAKAQSPAAPGVWKRRMGKCALEGCEVEFLRVHEGHLACCTRHADELRARRGEVRRTNLGERLDGDAQLAALRRTQLDIAQEAEWAAQRILSPEASHALWFKVLGVVA